VFHNRLTHSLKVGQIARRMAELLQRDQAKEVEELGGLDADAAEAAGLAHDLGHPPFGHIAEEELDRLIRSARVKDGYEGNAQSFRILTRLASSDARSSEDLPLLGLNLTRRTLNGVLKYPWAHREHSEYASKWGYYRTEKKIFDWVRDGCIGHQRSLIAEIMDWADDITFAIHDLLDFFCAGRIPIDRRKGRASVERGRLLSGMFLRKPTWAKARPEYEETLLSIVEEFPFEPDERFTASAADRARLFDFSTGLIRHFVQSIRIRIPTRDNARLVVIDAEAQREVEVLKQFIWEYVILNPDLSVPQEGQRAAIRTVFERLLQAAKKKDYHLFPPAYYELISEARINEECVRVVADCVSGMTEKEIIHFYHCLRGATA
jgi:dGTPase